MRNLPNDSIFRRKGAAAASAHDCRNRRERRIARIGLLDSALEGIFQTFGGVELYPTKEEKGARLGYSLISNHAFVDGNKRIGMYIMLTFLEVNGIRLDCTNEDVVEAGLGVASGKMSYEELLAWVKTHRT